MLFSSITFIYYFLPIFLLIYFIVPNKYKNFTLLIFSLIFYFYGEGIYLLILVFSCLTNYFLAILIEKYTKTRKSTFFLVLSLIINLGLLIYFKYTNFFIDNINSLFSTNIIITKIVMPLGISFFTFQTISYIVDVYNGTVKADKNLIDLTCYITMFPQLVAGPIVQYKTIKNELQKKDLSYENFGYGVKRFTIGLAKKVLLANSLGSLLKVINVTPTLFGYWLVAIAFTLQIYFDFSGYSDMAIGLGRMLGFKFLENFNYPYIAKSITDFWRRWHISLSSFFKEYIYIPLGGNRTTKIKWIRNIFIVWFLTGFWHGASWNFIIWGLFFAVILLGEKTIWGKYLENKKILCHIYTIFIVIISFVIFNGNSLNEVIISLKGMFGLLNIPIFNQECFYYLKSYSILLIISMILCTPIMPFIKEKIKKKKGLKIIVEILEFILVISLLLISTAYLIDASFNPFLYFRF